MESRHKGKRRWITAIGSAVAITGIVLALLSSMGNQRTANLDILFYYALIVIGGLIILANEGMSILDRDQTDKRERERSRPGFVEPVRIDCPQCGFQNKPESRKCRACGTALATETPGPSDSSPPR